MGIDNPAWEHQDSSKPYRRVMAWLLIRGDSICNEASEVLGKLDDMIADENGTVIYGVLTNATPFGIGEKRTVFPWRLLRIDHGRRMLILDMPPDWTERAPAFDAKHLPDVGDPAFQQQVETFYGAGSRR